MQKSRIVIDTNVVISAMRSKRGASSLLLSLAPQKRFSIHLSTPVALEYEEVLLRNRRTLGMTESQVSALVDALCSIAEKHDIHFLWRPTLRDIDDEAILELAVAAHCQFIVTYNKRDFVGCEQFNVQAITPKEFLERIGELP
ncbi:MAG: putative toxin-antitoxin system toxin component, PIN family [Sphaerospermopsis sp. SIO1G2]|nr:putative toxin-antitoxin system toxin component, PIN family [Sphaerospermopsis sp. SIO1G2]